MDENTEAALMRAGAQIEALQRQVEALRKDAERYRWLRDNPLWGVTYRLKQKTGNKEWRMRCDGELWGPWWPTHEQAIDHVMAETLRLGVLA